MVLENFKALIIKYIHYEGREMSIYLLRLLQVNLQRQNQLQAASAERASQRVLRGYIVGKGEESDDKLACQERLPKRTTKLGLQGHCFSYHKLKGAF